MEIDNQPSENNTGVFCNRLEAVELAGELLTCYPTQKPHDPTGYIEALEMVFARFPFAMVKSAVSPWGIPQDHPTYLPNIGFVNIWLTKKYEIAIQKPRQKSLAAPAPIRKKGQYTYGEFLKMAEEGKVKSGRPIGRFEKAGDRWNERIKDE